MFLVTGASSGIGYAAADAIASRGIAVLAVARDADRLQLLKERHAKHIKVVVADLSTSSGVDAVLRATDPLSHISGVVHAAGSSVPLASYQQLDSKHNDLQKHFGVSS